MATLGRRPGAAPLTSADIPDKSITAAKIVDAYDDKIQTNIALLAFKTAVNGSLAKYNLQDQIVDEYTDATGVNAGDSTNEELTDGVYRGALTGEPTVTENADSDPVVHGDYTYYKWTTVTTSGSYVTNTTQDHEYLVVAGGGAGGSGGSNEGGGGGGAGGYLAATGKSLVGGTIYTITVGVGGAGAGTSNGAPGGLSSLVGSDITDIIATGGGYGATEANHGNNGLSGGAGGSGGGSSAYFVSGSGSGTAGQGYNGGLGAAFGVGESGGGGGGHSAVGANATSSDAGDGGAGTNNDIGVSSGTVGYAGGGGGGQGTPGSASHGGGTGTYNGVGDNADANTGGGGGGAGFAAGNAGGNGGSGVVILRRLTIAISAAPDDLVLQSTDTTAEAVPTKADIVMLVEDAGSGVASLNTGTNGLQAYISMYETGGTKTWTQATLTDEGDWGTDKRILVAHDVTLSGTSGTQMAYKITTHNASAVYDTRIHATSIGWR